MLVKNGLQPVNVGEIDNKPLDDDREVIDVEEVIEAEVEEADPRRSIPTPLMPSPSDVEKHREDHIPYASWCDHCVEGRGREMGHRAVTDRDTRRVSTFSFYYLFMSDKGDIESWKSAADGSTDGDESRGIKILVAKDSKSRALFAHVVPTKGVDEQRFSVDMLTEDVKWLGHTKVILKSDNEVAILRLLTESLKELRVAADMEQLMEDHPPPFDSHANGDAESAAKAIRGQVQTLGSCFEARLGHRIPIKHPLMAWLVKHAAALITIRVRGHDGQTPYSRLRGRQFGTR